MAKHEAEAVERRHFGRRPILCCAALAAALLPVAACDRGGPPWKHLPSSAEQAYEIDLRTFKDGAYADQPFHLRIKSRRSPGVENRVMAASQCENVRILQGPDFLYIFYHELALSEFSSSKFYKSMPRPFLCDLRHPFCADRLKQALSAKERVLDICTYAGPEPAS